MSTTVNNNDASSSSTSASNNAESFDLRMKSMEDRINNLSLAFTIFMKEHMFSSNTIDESRNSDTNGQVSHDDDDTSPSDVDLASDHHSTSAYNYAESFDLRMKSMDDQINNLSLAFTRFMKEHMISSNTNSRSQLILLMMTLTSFQRIIRCLEEGDK
ncbi:hypothetical protein ACTFIW_005432 [Dictyostelium discoideum]